MNGSPLSNLRFPSLSNCERDSALYYLSSLCGPGSSTGISKNRTVSLNYSRGTGLVRNGEKFHWSRPNGRYLALSGPVCSRRIAAHTRHFEHFSGDS
jgi:hypothetical protein